jgi:hypothetical protein
MPLNNKDRAELYIREHARDWLTVDAVQAATRLPRTSIRAAFEELTANSILLRTGHRRQARYMYQDWKIEQLEGAE